jgi:hypothetical protein
MISVLLERTFVAKYGGRILHPEYFESDDEMLAVKYIQQFSQRYNHPPSTLDTLLTYAGADGSNISEVAAIAFEALRDEDEEFTLETTVDFAKTQAMKWALLYSVDDIEVGDLERPLERIREAGKVGLDSTDLGLDLVEDVSDWISETHVPKVPTGFWHVDRILRGGLANGELGVILAPPNRGKSQTLVNIGAGAAGLVYAAHVVHITLEMSKASCLKRYAARIVFRFQDSDEDDAKYATDVVEAAKKRLRGKIRVLSFPSREATVHDITVCIEQLIDIGRVDPEKLLIITDYADELRLPRGFDTRLGLIHIYSQHRAMASHFDCPVWTASQAGRQALSKKVITLDDFAEAFGKAAVSDVVIAKCETDEERRAGEGRLYMAKIRDEAGVGTQITYKQKPSLSMVTTGFAKYSDDASAKLNTDRLQDTIRKRKMQVRRRQKV